MSRNRDDDRDAIDEQCEAPPKVLRPIRQYPAIKYGFAVCPPEFRAWFLAVYDQPTAGYFTPPITDITGVGLARAVLKNIDADDRTEDDWLRGYGGSYLTDYAVVPDVIRFTLDHDDAAEWRVLAVKWAPKYLPAGECAARLAANLPRTADLESHHTAVRLAELAPDTPGLAERLLAATCAGWSRTREEDSRRVPGAELGAARLLERIGTPALVPEVREALAAGRCRVAGVVTECYLKWGGDAAELVRRSWAANPAPTPDECEAIAIALRELPDDTEELGERAAALVSHPRAYNAIRLSARLGCRGEVLLPWLVAQPIYSYRQESAPWDPWCADLLAAYLAALPRFPERWTDEDRWVNAVRGRPAGADEWVVFADWLAERGDPREEYVRVSHARAHTPDAVLDARLAAWLAAHGAAWQVVYDAIRTPA